MKVLKIVLLLIFSTNISSLVGMTLFDNQAQLDKQKQRMAVFVAKAKELIAKDDAVVIDHCKDCKGACVHCTAKDDATTPFKGSARLLSVIQKQLLDHADEGTWTRVDWGVQDRTAKKPGETGVSPEGQAAKPEASAGTSQKTRDDIVYVDESDTWVVCGKPQIEGQPANTQTAETVTGLTQDLQKLNLKEEDLVSVIEMVEIKDATITDEDIAAAVEPFLKELKKFLAAEFEKNKSTTGEKTHNKDNADDEKREREQLKRALDALFTQQNVTDAIALQTLLDERVEQDRAIQGYESTPVKLVKAVLPGSRDVACVAAVGKMGYDIAKPHVVQWYSSLTPAKVVSMMLNGGASLLLPQVKAVKLGMLFFNTLHSLIHICFVE